MDYNCKPITQKAKSSPFKISDFLVEGASDIAKKYTDAGESFAEGADMVSNKKKK